MKFKYVTVLLLSVLLSLNLSGQRQKGKTDANLFGHVVSEGEHLPFVTITIEGTIIGTTTDETGHYTIYNLPRGKFVVQARSVGYKPLRKEIVLKKGRSFELNFELEKDVLGLAEVVVTGDRNEKNRKDAAVIVNTLTPKLFNVINSVTLNEGLNFCPGLRMEYNCQNCGFSQIRMNGMEGPYSQILINGRPIFSGLAGVYGLELIPANMLERIEVVRGGGSALYGSNAIAGTINLILKDPIANAYEGGFNGGASGVGMNGSGDPATDYSVNANASVISGDSKTGLSLYGFYRNRNPFDANNDGFSELTKISNTTFGTRFYHRFGLRTKISADFFNIKEERRGGNMFDYPKHEAGIAEAVDHNITTGAITLDHFTRGTDLWSTYFSAQQVLRDSYYGAGQSLQDYGNTKGLTYTLGTQYNAHFDHANVTVGVENREEWLTDQKLAYPDFENAVIENGKIVEIPHTENTLVADQHSSSLGGFAQIDVTWNRLNVSAGGRFDHYTITNLARESAKKGDVFSPRLTLKYDIYSFLQARVSYSQGYRAPQIFDEDLHIETSGSRQVLHQNDPALKQETSHSYIASIDFNKKVEEVNIGFLAEGFYTRLNDAFVNEYGEANENGVVVYTRKNADGGATVKGINLELNLVPQKAFLLKAGYTFQASEYDEIQEFDEFRFFRTPDQYGFLTVDWQPLKKMGISATANYTGKMLVPYFGPRIDNPEAGMLVETSPFLDLGLKARYNIKLNGATLQVFAGVKNLFNAYQGDFDEGIERDPGYVYGPGLPRTIYTGLKIGNMLK